MNIVNSQSLLNYNTFKVDVIAELFKSVESEKDVLELLQNERVIKKNKFILGGGSNILFTKNINGLVIHNQIKGLNIIKETKNNVEIEIGGGEIWDNLVDWTTRNQYYGIENLSLIPGSVGAAPIQNIGAYGCELQDCFTKLEAINLNTREKKIFTKSDCNFGYRNSIFKNELKNHFIITKVYLSLMKEKKLNLNYNGLIDKIKKKRVSIEDVRNAIIKIRKSKLPDPNHIGNAGSFFKNPIISEAHLKKIMIEHPEIPYFKKDGIKVPAAWLIEKLKWKGHQEKSCGVYNNHALIIINHNHATGKEINDLARNIKQDVYKNFNIILEEEISII